MKAKITRQKIETWMKDHKPIYVEFDERTEIVEKITEEPVSKTHYRRRESSQEKVK